MSQAGNTDFLRVSSVGSVPIFTDTMIDEATDDANYYASDPLAMSATTDEVAAIIYDISVPDRNDLVDDNGDKLPDDVIFTGMDLRLRVSGAPGASTQVRGYALTTAASIPAVNWNTSDGSTLWYPDQYGETTGTGADLVYEKVVHGGIVINTNINPSDNTYFTLPLSNLRKKPSDVDFGSNFQIIVFASIVANFGVHSSNHTADTDHCPHAKFYFIKPEPDAATITVTPNSFGHNGTVNIVKPTSDKNLQQYSLAHKSSAGVVQTDNTTDITDAGIKSILLTDLTQVASGGTPNYVKRYPNGDRTSTHFKLFSEDLYNTNTNATPSNEVNPRIRPSATGKFLSYNAAGAADTDPAVGEEMELRVLPLDVYGKISEYAINFDVESSLVDTGITWNATSAPHGGATWTDNTSSASYTKLFNSNPDAFTLGETLKITSDVGPEFLIVVGEDEDNGYTVVKRGQLNTAVLDHTGLADTTKIYKVNYDDFYFVKPNALSPSLSIQHSFSKVSTDIHTNHVAIIVKDEYGWSSFPDSLNGRTGITVAESTPVAKLTTSRTKVAYAKYGDQTTGLTLSLSNSKAVGSNREIVQYAFAYTAYNSATVATANALTNNNEGFETGSKRVQLISTGADDLSSSTWRIFGLASFAVDDSKVSDTNATFSHYAYVSEQLTAANRGGTGNPLVPVSSTNFWKNVECVVCEEIDEHDDGNRFLLMIHPNDVTTYAASALNEGDNLVVAETPATVDDSSFYKAGDIVSMSGDDNAPFELALVESVDSSTIITLRRGYLFTTAQEIPNNGLIKLVESKDIKQMWVNKELRSKCIFDTVYAETKYMWGGLAQIETDDISFQANSLWDLNEVHGRTSFNDTDWYANGFAVGDVIKVKSNQTENGTFAAPKYYKIMDIYQSSGAGDYNFLYIAPSTDMLSDEEAMYVSTSFTTNDNRTADIIRYDNARNPTMTCALYNYNASSNAYTGDSDTVKFEGMVVDNDSTSFLANSATDTLTVRATGLHTLDLDLLASNGDIAILNYRLARSGGVSATMPLGNRRYPIGGTTTKLGSISLTIGLRILTQAGYRQIYSLIEGDRYDYVFLDSTKVDLPDTAYKTFRMKLNSGEINKDPDMNSQYTAALNMLVLGEEIV
jgi:hypothetical protein